MRRIIFILFTSIFYFNGAVLADPLTIEKTGDKGAILGLTGEAGSVTNSLFQFAKYLAADPNFPPYDQADYSIAELTVKKEIIDPEAIDGEGYSAKIVIDGKRSTMDYDKSSGKLIVAGAAALTLIRGMWLMAMDYPENITVKRTGSHAEITLEDIYSYGILCRKFYEPIPDSHLVKLVAACTIAVDRR